MSNSPNTVAISSKLVFRCLFIARFLASQLSPINDCDEVFNYLEPLHYLLKGTGFQTWEYSPNYLIRSWIYPLLNSIPVFLISKVYSNKITIYVTFKILLAAISANADAFLYHAIATYMSVITARYFFIGCLFSTGFFISSTQLLPSTLAMYCTSLALSFAILPSNLQNNIKLILSIGIGSLIGWPFMGVLIVPLFLNEILNLKGFVSMFKVTGRWITMGIAVILSLSVPIVLTDAFFYKKYAFVPINIINYNVFSGNVSKGPDIFGTEPFDFYFKNLFLNFNLVFILALLSAPILTLSCITLFFQDQARLNPTIFGKYFARISIFYLWLIIFTLQPHKEERFMFVVYPMICFNASMTLYFIERHVEMFRLPRFISNVFSKVFSPTILVVFVVLSLSRSASLYYNYHSPISVYKSFYNETQNLDVEKRLCLGKEWHRFPSHFFIPDKVNVQFLKSDFNGLLPKHFENKENGWRSGTWTVPSDMNDINKEEFGRYVNVETCDFLIDLELYQLSETKNEPSYVKDTKNWEIIECQKFLNHQKTPSLNRIFYIPDFIFEDQRVWGDYCILKKKNL